MTLLPTLHLKNIFSSSEISQLLRMKESLPVTREKSYNREIRADENWCRDLISKKIPQLKFGFGICYCHFLVQTLPYIIHTDGPLSSGQKGHFNVLIPLQINGESAHTVTFEQSFGGPGKAFVKGRTEDELEVYGFTKDYSEINGLIETPFPKQTMDSHLDHIDPDSLTGLSLDSIVEWQIGDVILFDRYRLHCSSSFRRFALKDKTSLVIATREPG